MVSVSRTERSAHPPEVQFLVAAARGDDRRPRGMSDARSSRTVRDAEGSLNVGSPRPGQWGVPLSGLVKGIA